MIALLAASARADTDVSCDLPVVSATVPGADAIGVPVDARLRFFFGGCAETWQLAAFSGDAVEPFATGVASDRFAELTPAEPMPADTAIRLIATDSYGYVTESGFHTGAGRVVGIAGTPTATITSAVRYVESTGVQAYVAVTPVDDADHLSVIELSHGDDKRTVPAVDASDIYFAADRGNDDEWCVDVAQIDGRGARTAGPRVCVVPTIERPYGSDTVADTGATEPPAGACATAPTSSILALFLGGMLARRRRCSS
jgi:hypothetical protein